MTLTSSAVGRILRSEGPSLDQRDPQRSEIVVRDELFLDLVLFASRPRVALHPRLLVRRPPLIGSRSDRLAETTPGEFATCSISRLIESG